MKYEFKSKEEIQFSEWMDECKKYNFIEDWEYEPNSYLLIDAKKYTETIEMKTKTKEVERTLHQSASYTPDFKVIFTKHGLEAFKDVFKKSILGSTTKDVVYFDTKGSFSRHDDGRYFSIIQKLFFEKHGYWVEKIIPKKLFKQTFIPERQMWIKNRKTSTKTKLGSQCNTIKEFVEDLI